MVRPATDADIDPATQTDFIYMKKKDLTANIETEIFKFDLDADERITVESIGTNGGYPITLRLRNKKSPVGDDINGLQAPITPERDRYKLSIPQTFEGALGDELILVAVSSATLTNIKFDIRGHGNKPTRTDTAKS
jgi:hypothetical protein